MSVSPSSPQVESPGKLWWANGGFLVVTHLAAFIGVYYYPWYAVKPASLWSCFVLWQAACFGVTIGYHRLYSHRSFRAALAVRIVLAVLGASSFQGSIKWWCLRHRLHHRFTDDPVHDPYCATRGLLWSHIGWLFYKPNYEKMESVDRDDLENDPVVRIQHQHYLPFALATGLVFPALLGLLWGDVMGAFVWGGLVARLMIWHCTFCVNSLAHWDGLQPYSDETTSKTNLFVALLTCGEGNHNFHHSFPHDYRSSPDLYDWDPTKWIIILLHKFGLATGLRQARSGDVNEAIAYMYNKNHPSTKNGQPIHDKYVGEREEDEMGFVSSDQDTKDVKREVWTEKMLFERVRDGKGRGVCLVVVGDYVVDVTGYLGEHPGGSAIMRKYSVPAPPISAPSGDEKINETWREATWAFGGGMNQHSRAARRHMRELIVAKLRG